MIPEHWTRRVEVLLDRALPQTHPIAPTVLLEAMRYSVLAPGKRLRPALMYEVGCVFHAMPEDIDPFAAAIEMLHAASLIHDDMPCMDDDDLRRGRPTCHRKYGESIALLAGDALMAHAFTAMFDPSHRRPRADDAAREIACAAGLSGIAGGQALDMLCEGTDILDKEETLRKLHLGKTAAIFEAAAVCGALLGDADEEALSAMRTYGRQMGMAFQISDDLLNHAGCAENLGKASGTDAARGKLTAVSVWGQRGAQERLRTTSDSACEALDVLGDEGMPLRQIARNLERRQR